MELIKLLSSSSVGYFNKHLAKELGLNEAIILSELCSKYEYWEKQEKLTEEGYFFETMDMIEENTTLTQRQQRPALKTLVDKGIIETKLIGLPATRYFKINEDKLLQIINPRCDKMSYLDMTKCNSSNTITNNIDNTNNKLLDIIEKPKKKNLYDKCVDEVLSRNYGKSLMDLVFDYLNLRLSMKDKPLYGVNQWKGLLNKLESLSSDCVVRENIVKQSIEKGWGTFVEISSYNKNTKYTGNTFGELNVSSTPMSEEEKQEHERWLSDNGIEAF